MASVQSMKPPHPATTRQKSGLENSVCNKHSSEVFISSLHHQFEGARERVEMFFWENFFFCFGSQKINLLTRTSAKTQSELKSRWPISSPSWCGWLFIINISCRSSCMFKGTLPHCTENAPPPSFAVREPPYPAIMPCQSHLNNPDNKTKAINLWYWPGCERQGDAISKYQQRQIFCVRMIRNTAAAVTHWSAALKQGRTSPAMILSSDTKDGIYVCVWGTAGGCWRKAWNTEATPHTENPINEQLQHTWTIQRSEQSLTVDIFHIQAKILSKILLNTKETPFTFLHTTNFYWQ